MTRNPWSNGNTDDDAISVGRAIVEQLTAVNKNISNAIRSDAPGSYNTVAGGTAANFSVGLEADLVEIDLQISPAADADLWLRLSNTVGVFLNGATDYWYSFTRNGVSVASGGAAQAVVATNMNANVAQHFYFRIWRSPEDARHYITWNGLIIDGTTGNTLVAISGGMRLTVNTLPLDGIQFLFSGGINMVSYFAAIRYTNYGP